MNNSSFKGVQALRGLAALSVVLFHFSWNIKAVNPGLGDKLFGWGGTGVDMFFLISGFVITLSASKSPKGIKGMLSFLKKRALRILPAYYIILIVSFFLTGAMSTFHYQDKTANLISAFTFIPIVPEHGPFYVDDSGMYGIRWTLNYEVLFYLFISVALLFSRRWMWSVIFFTTTLIILPILLWQTISLEAVGYETSSPLLGLITNPIIWLFITGMVFGLILPYLKWVSPKVMTYASVICIISAAYLFSHGLFLGHGILSSGWIYALILISVVLSEGVIGKYVPSILIWLGDVSFSLYLIHTLMNTGIGKRFASIGLEDGYGRLLLSLVLSLILAQLSWRYIERPFIQSGKKSSAERCFS